MAKMQKITAVQTITSPNHHLDHILPRALYYWYTAVHSAVHPCTGIT